MPDTTPVRLKDVCQGIADEVHAVTRADDWLAQVVSASRAYLHQFNREDADSLICSVAPETRESGPLTRGKDSKGIRVVLTISKKVTDTSNATVDPLVDTVELLQDYFEGVDKLTG